MQKRKLLGGVLPGWRFARAARPDAGLTTEAQFLASPLLLARITDDTFFQTERFFDLVRTRCRRRQQDQHRVVSPEAEAAFPVYLTVRFIKPAVGAGTKSQPSTRQGIIGRKLTISEKRLARTDFVA